MKKLMIFLLILNSFTINADDNSSTFKVKKIIFQGLKQETGVIPKIKINIGDKISFKNIRDTINDLFNSGNYENIKIYKKNQVLIIKVKERPIINNISFIGNKSLTNELIKKQLELVGINLGERLNLTIIDHIERSIKDFFYNNGKYNTSINIKIIKLSNNKVNIQFLFDEKSPSKIVQINILGNNFFSTKKLISHFKLHFKDKWWKFFINDKFQKEKLIEDIDYLKNIYLEKGFACFNINFLKISLTPNKKDIYLTYYISEGNKYKLSEYKIYGNLLSYEKEIKKLVNLNIGELFNGKKINLIENNIKNFLSKYGYIFSLVYSNLEINDNNNTVKINILINPGDRFYINQIKFKGNYISKDRVLRREMRQLEGSLLNYQLLIKGKERLNRLGLFENVDFEILKKFNNPSKLDVIYKVKEHNTGSIDLGAGFGIESGLNFQLNVKQDNWLGTGNLFGFSVSKNNYQTNVNLTMKNPYLTINGLSLGIKCFLNKLNANEKNLSDLNLTSCGLTTNMSCSITDQTTLELGLDYSSNNIYKIKPQVSILRNLEKNVIIPKCILKQKFNENKLIDLNTNDLFIILGLNFNNVDRGYFPTSGSYTSIYNKITLPSSQNEYFKIHISSYNYITLNKKYNFIFLYRLHLGYANGFRGKEIPFYDNFYAGGYNSVRGFHSNTIGPKAVYYVCHKNYKNSYNYNCSIHNSNDAIGGNATIVTSTELILPCYLYGLKNSNIIRTSIFIDLGTVWDTHWINHKQFYDHGIPNYQNPGDVRISSGISVQWISPIGPLVFSYAKPIKKYYGDQIEKFQFNIGKNF